jgi:hypothetical protein
MPLSRPGAPTPPRSGCFHGAAACPDGFVPPEEGDTGDALCPYSSASRNARRGCWRTYCCVQTCAEPGSQPAPGHLAPLQTSWSRACRRFQDMGTGAEGAESSGKPKLRAMSVRSPREARLRPAGRTPSSDATRSRSGDDDLRGDRRGGAGYGWTHRYRAGRQARESPWRTGDLGRDPVYQGLSSRPPPGWLVQPPVRLESAQRVCPTQGLRPAVGESGF